MSDHNIKIVKYQNIKGNLSFKIDFELNVVPLYINLFGWKQELGKYFFSFLEVIEKMHNIILVNFNGFPTCYWNHSSLFLNRKVWIWNENCLVFTVGIDSYWSFRKLSMQSRTVANNSSGRSMQYLPQLTNFWIIWALFLLFQSVSFLYKVSENHKKIRKSINLSAIRTE